MKEFLLVTDLDNTLVGDQDASDELNQILQAERDRFYLVYATGRSYASACNLRDCANLLEPDYWITAVGSEIYHKDRMDCRWSELLSQCWNRDAVWAIAERFTQLEPQDETEQNPWKASFWLTRVADLNVIELLKKEFKLANLAVQVIFSSGRDVDLVPTLSNKGNATAYLSSQLYVSFQNILVCGDSGNDISLFEQATNGVIVNNAQPELIHWYYKHRLPNHYLARSPYAWGILEALFHFKFLSKTKYPLKLNNSNSWR